MTPRAAGLPARLLAAALLVCSAVACTATGQGTATPVPDSASISSTTSASTSTTAPVDGPGPPAEAAPDPKVDDVADPVFDGSGDPRIDVAHYDVTVRADPGNPVISGTAILTLSARTAGPLPSFTLDLSGPVVSAATVNGAQAKVVVGTQDTGEIKVIPAEPLEPKNPAEVTLTYAGTPAQSTFPGLDAQVGWQADGEGGWFTMSEPDGTSTWVPVSEHPSDKATWKVTLDTPKDSVGVSNGHLTSKEIRGERRMWVWDTDQPMASYVVLAAVGRYDLVERTGPNGVRVVFAFPKDLPAASRAGFDELDQIISFYASTFGALPDDDSGAIVVPTPLSLALETQTRPLFGRNAARGGSVWALAHEVAHQWYGDAVSVESWADLWLNEGFATYADWLYRDHIGDAPIAELARGAFGGVPAKGLAVLDPAAASSFDGAVYEGGARALQALRLTVGDEAFFEILKRWFTDNDGANVTTDDFVALAEEVSGRDLEKFFDDWLRSPTQPALPG